MSTALQSPSNMKETGLSWITDIPSHWEVKRAKLILLEVDSRSAKGDEVLLSVSQYTGVTPRRNRDNSDEQDTRSESLVGYKKVSAGDLVVNIMLAWNGSLGASNFDGVVSPAYCVYRFEGDNQPEYYHHLLRTDAYKGRIKVDSRGVVDSRLRLYSENLFRIELPVPPPDEQAQIVRFIRHLDQRVNRLVKAKRRLIELLNEQKQAIIHQAVTRGLDPTVPLKPSGLAWVPQVPRHWDVVPNGSLMTPKKRLVGERHTEFRLLSLTKQGVIVRDLSENKGKFSKDLGTSQEVKAGDIVFCLFDIPETPRTVGLSSHDGMITSAYTVMTPRDSEVARFVEALYIAMDNGKLLSPMYSGLRNTIAPSRFLSMRMPLPPKGERAHIVNFVEAESASIDATLAKVMAEIDLIREYRTRLVADVVTGQLDVRQHPWANTEIEDSTDALPDDAETEGGLEETEEGWEEVGV